MEASADGTTWQPLAVRGDQVAADLAVATAVPRERLSARYVRTNADATVLRELSVWERTPGDIDPASGPAASGDDAAAPGQTDPGDDDEPADRAAAAVLAALALLVVGRPVLRILRERMT